MSDKRGSLFECRGGDADLIFCEVNNLSPNLAINKIIKYNMIAFGKVN